MKKNSVSINGSYSIEQGGNSVDYFDCASDIQGFETYMRSIKDLETKTDNSFRIHKTFEKKLYKQSNRKKRKLIN